MPTSPLAPSRAMVDDLLAVATDPNVGVLGILVGANPNVGFKKNIQFQPIFSAQTIVSCTFFFLT
jgi:hypothetical protein